MYSQTGKTHDVIETGYHIDTPPEKRKVKKYVTSELRLIETLESVCNRLLEYRLHKERTDSTRFARGGIYQHLARLELFFLVRSCINLLNVINFA